jgi:hypothetical protein
MSSWGGAAARPLPPSRASCAAAAVDAASAAMISASASRWLSMVGLEAAEPCRPRRVTGEASLMEGGGWFCQNDSRSRAAVRSSSGAGNR